MTNAGAHPVVQVLAENAKSEGKIPQGLNPEEATKHQCMVAIGLLWKAALPQYIDGPPVANPLEFFSCLIGYDEKRHIIAHFNPSLGRETCPLGSENAFIIVRTLLAAYCDHDRSAAEDENYVLAKDLQQLATAINMAAKKIDPDKSHGLLASIGTIQGRGIN